MFSSCLGVIIILLEDEDTTALGYGSLSVLVGTNASHDDDIFRTRRMAIESLFL